MGGKRRKSRVWVQARAYDSFHCSRKLIASNFPPENLMGGGHANPKPTHYTWCHCQGHSTRKASRTMPSSLIYIQYSATNTCTGKRAMGVVWGGRNRALLGKIAEWGGKAHTRKTLAEAQNESISFIKDGLWGVFLHRHRYVYICSYNHPLWSSLHS